MILATAAFFRLYHIDSAPPGLYPDEAMNGNNAIQALESGDYKIFYSDNNGREGLFMNVIAFSIKIFGKNVWSLRIVSALAGIITVLGLYLLTKELFNKNIAYLSSFLMAVSFWHVNFSRISFRAILAPMFLVFAFYFLWQGLRSKHLLPFALSGLSWGLGFYTYIAFRAMPLALILVLLAYWHFIKKDYDIERYHKTLKDISRGFILLLLVAMAITAPLIYYFYQNPGDFFGRTGQISIFNSYNPIGAFTANFGKTLAMFNFIGDNNWRHNFAGSPLLLWPVGVLFAVGLIRSFIKWIRLKKKHGHFSTVQSLLLSWFFVGLLPSAFSNEGIPHALRAIIVAPVVYIFAAEGLWWLYEFVSKSYEQSDLHEIKIKRLKIKEGGLITSFAVTLFLAAVGLADYDKYFNKWAENPMTRAYFNQDYVDIGNKLNGMDIKIKKYVLVNAGGVMVYQEDPFIPGSIKGVPMPAQTVMFITDTSTAEKYKLPVPLL